MKQNLTVPNNTLNEHFSLSKITKAGFKQRLLASAILLACGSVAMDVKAESFCDQDDEYIQCSQNDTIPANGNVSIADKDNFSRIRVENDSPYTFTVRDANLNNQSSESVWEEADYNETYIQNEAIIEVSHNNSGDIILDNWNINLDKDRINNILIGLHGYFESFSDSTILTLTNSKIETYSDTVFAFNELHYDEQSASGTVDLNILDINGTTIINNKEHTYVPIVGYDSNNDYQLEEFLGSIFYFGNKINFAYVENDLVTHVNANFNINNSHLESEVLLNIVRKEYDSYEDQFSEVMKLNFNNSEGKFKNLINYIDDLADSWGDVEGDNPEHIIEINLNNGSTLTSGIYSHAHGGGTMENTTLNLANGSVFNYLGGCESECSLYDYGEYITEPEYEHFTPTTHFEDSYIHTITIESGSSLVFVDTGTYKSLYVDNLNSDGTGVIIMNTNVANRAGDKLNVDTATGQFNLFINDSGQEPTSTDHNLSLINIKHGEDNQFILNNGLGVDIGAYTYDLYNTSNGGEYTWFLGYGSMNDNNERKTSPATDGMLSIASATQFILNDELANFRKRRGDMHINNDGSANAWGRYIGSRMEMDGPAFSSYKLNRHGIEVGFDWNTQVENERLIYGFSASYSDNAVKHARGGKSQIDAYTLGLHATWLNENNVYLDGVVKYIHFNNDVQIRSTNGSLIDGNYKQNGAAAALELGYKYTQGETGSQMFVEPYTRISYASVSSKNVRLNGGLEADIKNQNSFIGEVGVSVGKEFTWDDGATVAPYVKLAVQHEFIDSNDVYINATNKFTNDFSGTRGNYGAGVNLAVNNDVNLYAEFNYMSGSNVESPINGNVGFRVSF